MTLLSSVMSMEIRRFAEIPLSRNRTLFLEPIFGLSKFRKNYSINHILGNQNYIAVLRLISMDLHFPLELGRVSVKHAY